MDALRGDRYSYPVRIEVPPRARSGFGGAPGVVPGTVEAEHFDVGAEGLTYHDTDMQNTGGALRTETGVDIAAVGDGYHVVDIRAGEWLEYSIAAAEAGRYRIRTYASSPAGGGLFYLDAGGSRTRRLSVPQTGGEGTTTPVNGEIDLPAGETILRIQFLTSGDHSIDRFEIDRPSDTSREETPRPRAPEAFPNPVADEIVLRLDAVGRNASATIYDSIGRPVLTAPVESGTNRLSVRSLAPGAYVIRITSVGRPATAIPIVVL